MMLKGVRFLGRTRAHTRSHTKAAA
jgi:hypothetical protein